jgi:predicted nucleotidyltransferase
MDLSRPFAALSPGVESDVLVALVLSTAPKTGRELARHSGRSVTGVQHALDRLVEEGLVHRGQAGRSFLYTLNRDHILAPAAELMAAARFELVRRLRELIGAWSAAPFHASLFGSAARGDGNAASDIDLLMVRPKGFTAEDPRWQGQLDELGERIVSWTGNHAGIVELAESELSPLLLKRPPVIREIVEDGIDLAGIPIRELVREHS